MNLKSCKTVQGDRVCDTRTKGRKASLWTAYNHTEAQRLVLYERALRCLWPRVENWQAGVGFGVVAQRLLALVAQIRWLCRQTAGDPPTPPHPTPPARARRSCTSCKDLMPGRWVHESKDGDQGGWKG